MEEGQPPPGRTVAALPLYLVRRTAAAAVGVLSALLTGRPTLALTRAIDVAFASGYAAQRWGLIKRTAASREAVGEPA